MLDSIIKSIFSVYGVMAMIILVIPYFLKGKKNKKLWFVIISCAIMFFVLGFRDCYTVGNDSASSYLHRFQDMTNTSWNEVFTNQTKNIGFNLFAKLICVLSKGDYQVFTVIEALLVMTSFAAFIYKFSVNAYQSVICFWGMLYYPFMFNALKQALAMAILLWAFDAAVKKKLIRFLLIMLLAYLLHQPSIIFLPAYWIMKMKIDRNYLLMLAGMLVLTYIFRSQLLVLMNDIYSTEITDNGLRFLANKVLVMIGIVALAIWMRPPSEDDKLYCQIMSLMGIAIVLQTFANYNNTFERLADYYFQFSILFVPMIFENVKPKFRYFTESSLAIMRTWIPVGVYAFFVYRFLMYCYNNAYMSYRFCF